MYQSSRDIFCEVEFGASQRNNNGKVSQQITIISVQHPILENLTITLGSKSQKYHYVIVGKPSTFALANFQVQY